jgi:hypothetical protein
VGIDRDGNIRMVTFKYQEQMQEEGKTELTSQTRYIEAPFLALTGIPNLAVEQININFELEVRTAEDDKSKTDTTATNETTGGWKSWWSPASVQTKFTGSVSHSSEQTRHTDTRAKYSFSVSARKQPTPEAFSRIVEAIVNGSAKPTEKELPSNLVDVKK